MYPENYRYTKEHEWVHVEDGVGTIGITFYAQKELGDIVYVEAPSEIYAPVSGEVVAANETLANTPELLNSDPHGDGWIAKIKLSVPQEIDRLLSAADYQAYLGAE